MATVSTSNLVNGLVPVTGSGHTGTKAILMVAFTSSRRRFLEMHTVPVVAGAIAADVPVPITGGTVVVKALDTAFALQATSGNQAV